MARPEGSLLRGKSHSIWFEWSCEQQPHSRL